MHVSPGDSTAQCESVYTLAICALHELLNGIDHRGGAHAEQWVAFLDSASSGLG